MENNLKSECKALSQDKYQLQKIHIENLEIDENIETYERDLKKFLAKYGNILDIKILANSNFKRGR